MRFIARLLQECHETHGCSAGHVQCIVLSYDSLVTKIVRILYGCLTLDVILCEIVCDLPHGLYVLSPMTKPHNQKGCTINVKQALTAEVMLGQSVT